MIAALASLIGLCAFAAWLVAAWSALQVIALAPKGKGMATYWNLGWWRHAQIEQDIGPAAAPHLARYRRAFMAFFGCIFLAIATVFLLLLTAENGGGA